MSGRARARARGAVSAVVGAAVIAVLVVRFGAGPFVTALHSLQVPVVLAAAAVTVGSTLCAAYRWRLVTLGLDVPVGLGAAIRGYYRSQFLNATLPGGVLGDVHRGLAQGSGGYPLGRCLRTVAWERLLGQACQLALTGAVILAWPSPLRPPAAVGFGVLTAAAVLAIVLAIRAGRRRNLPRGGAMMRSGTCPRRRPGAHGDAPVHPGASRRHRAIRALAADWRDITGVPGARVRIALTSIGAVGGHVLVFVLAARSVDATVPIAPLVPVILLVLLVAALPLTVAGWGPREGAAAWGFGLAGFGAAQGLSVSVVYAVLSLIAVLPGAVVLLMGRGGRHA